METLQTKPNLKRQHENAENNEQRKIQRLESAAKPVSATKIIDLNDFCLIKIFGHLDIQSLLNVVIANGCLRPAAIDVYQRKFGKKVVEICEYKDGQLNMQTMFSNGRVPKFTSSVLQEWDDEIKIFDLKSCLQYLRCFGPSVSNLTIDYNFLESKRYKHLHRYVNNYCGESLVRITILRMPKIAIKKFKKNFTNVRDVEIIGSHAGQQLKSFVKWFPNLHRLVVSEVSIFDRFCKKPFQYLEHLRICDLRCYGSTTLNHIAALLNGIYRLKSLEITMTDDCVSIEAMLDLIKDNRFITKLVWWMHHDKVVNASEVGQLICKHPALIELDLKFYRFKADDAIALFRQLKSLKKINFRTRYLEYFDFESQLDDDWECCVDFLDWQWPQITLKR